METSTLTDRQREIKERLDAGMGAREIAQQLGISRNAVYQQIQRMRRNGVLEAEFTPTGVPPRAIDPGMGLLRSLLESSSADEVEAAGTLALVEELKRTRDDLQHIVSRLRRLVPAHT